MIGTSIHKKDIEEMLEKMFPQRVEEELNKLKITSPNTKGSVIHFHRKRRTLSSCFVSLVSGLVS